MSGEMMFTPKDLDGTAALLAAEMTRMGKARGERDTEFVKRIVCAYLNALPRASAFHRAIAAALADVP